MQEFYPQSPMSLEASWLIGIANRLSPPDTLPTIKTDDDLKAFLREYFGVILPDVQVCEHHSTPFRAFADAYFARHRVSIWKGSRGLSGKTYTLALLAAVEACSLGASVSILGGSGEQSKRVSEYQNSFWMHPRAPRYLLAGDPGITRTRLIFGNSITALTASSKSVRGPHPQRGRYDEVDEMELKILDAASGQVMGAKGIPAQTVYSSTKQYAFGTMFEIEKRAAERGWPIFEWCYKETAQPHGWLSQEEIEGKRSDVTQATWDVEYDMQEPSDESNAILPDAVEAMFSAELGHVPGDLGQLYIFEKPEPIGKYASGCDWAKDVDFTVEVVFRIDVRPCRLVAFRRTGRRKWPVMISGFDKLNIMYHVGDLSSHDATGVGDVADDYLETDSEGMKLSGKTRENIFQQYIVAIEDGEYIAPQIDWMFREHRHVRLGDLFGAGHPPDSFVAGAMAHHARGKAPKAALVQNYT